MNVFGRVSIAKKIQSKMYEEPKYFSIHIPSIERIAKLAVFPVQDHCVFLSAIVFVHKSEIEVFSSALLQIRETTNEG